VPPAITIYIGRTNALAALVADRIAVSVQRRDRALLALATGSTPLRIGLWDELARRCDDGVLDLSTATFINPDEWLGLPKAHPESYASYVDRHIASRIRTNVIVPDGMSSTAVDDARTLDARIAAAGGFDFALLGLGINGHVGFFEPDVAGLPSQAYTPVIADVNRARYAADHFDGDMSASSSASRRRRWCSARCSAPSRRCCPRPSCSWPPTHSSCWTTPRHRASTSQS
jgi:6-phosphogluconolactonase/glucosamine-6-phosphate isomerase/deaminase